MQATYHHAFLFENLANHDFVNFTIPVSRQVVLGASWTRLDVSDTPRFATLTGSRGAAGLLPVGSRKDRSDAYVITLARMHHHPRLAGESGYLPVEMPYAVNLKVIRQAFGSDTATGIGIDAGYMLKIGLKDAFGSENAGHVSFGITGKDIIGTRVYWKTRGDETVKPSYRMGFSFTQPVAPINGTLVLAEQNSIYNGDSLRFGLEYWYAETVAIRIGNAEAFTIGAGLYF